MKIFIRWTVFACLCLSILLITSCSSTPEKATLAAPTSTATIQPTETPTATITPPTETATSIPIFSLCRDTSTSVAKKNTVKRLVYIASEGKKDVWVWDMGQKPIRLTTFGDVANVSISEDGKTIFFTRQTSPLTPDETKYWNDLWTIQVDGTGLRELPPDNANNPDIYDRGDFEYSPDGKWLFVYNRDNMELYNENKQHQQSDFLKYQGMRENDHILWTPFWSKDSKSFLLVLSENAFVNETTTFKVTRVWPEEQMATKIGVFKGFYPSVKISPDQKFMLYRRDANMRPNELHLVDLDEKKDIIFSKQDDLSVDAWSPNSRDFIFDIVYSTYLGNVCKDIEAATPLPYLNSFQFPIWLDSTTLLIVELGDDRLRDRYLSFEDLTGTYKSGETVLALRSYDFAIVSP